MDLSDEKDGGLEYEDLETEEKLKERFARGRDGDHLMGIPFECDLCHFRNCNGRDPALDNARDNFTLLCIRRATLDAMWGRETSTVSGNLSRLKRDYREAMYKLSIAHPLPQLGNDTVEDRVGMTCALITLNASMRTGTYTKHLQWDTMRRTPTWYNNSFAASEGTTAGSIWSGDERKLYGTSAPTASKWFSRFMLGAKRRMGVIRRQNEALTVPQLLGILRIGEEDWQESRCEKERQEIEEVMSFVVIAFCVALRGEEVPLTTLDGMASYWKEAEEHVIPHIMVTLKGKFKAENNLRWHCLPIADGSKSNIPARRWISRQVHRRVLAQKGGTTGMLFARARGGKASFGDYDPLFREYLTRLREQDPGLFTQVVKIEDYSLRRSPRRGAITTAANNKVDETTIELIGRWRKKEAAKGAEPGLSMRQVYTQVSHAVEALSRFSLSH